MTSQSAMAIQKVYGESHFEFEQLSAKIKFDDMVGAVAKRLTAVLRVVG